MIQKRRGNAPHFLQLQAENAKNVGEIFYQELLQLQQKHNKIIGSVQGKGLVYGLHMVKKGAKEPDGKLAADIVEKAIKKGLMMFPPVGLGSGTIKICPPLISLYTGAVIS